jgi:hypothetical protein
MTLESNSTDVIRPEPSKVGSKYHCEDSMLFPARAPVFQIQNAQAMKEPEGAVKVATPVTKAAVETTW